MLKTIKVKYADGALKPMEALDMEEGAEALATPDVLHKMSSDERMNRSRAAAGGRMEGQRVLAGVSAPTVA